MNVYFIKMTSEPTSVEIKFFIFYIFGYSKKQRESLTYELDVETTTTFKR